LIFLQYSYEHRDLHSFPTRRSSDLSLGKPDLTPEEQAFEAVLVARFNEITQRLATHGWRRATKDDKLVAAAATRRDLVSWERRPDRKSTRLNSSHGSISYAVFCLKK